jgi:FlaA1/EpsC-like NDP-sugar epimerase
MKFLVFQYFGLYRGWWRYVGMRDLLAALKGTWVSTAFFLGFVYAVRSVSAYAFDMQLLLGWPRSIFLLDLMLTIGMVCGVRIIVRFYYEAWRPIAEDGLKRLVIIGAGIAGETVLRQIRRTPVEQYEVVGFVDDDLQKRHLLIHGVPVLGPLSRLETICRRYTVEELLIAIPEAGREQMKHTVEQCQGTRLRFRTIPAMSDLIDGKVTISQIRDVDINDLLGRAPVVLDTKTIGEFLTGRVVMVTGAGGSIGSEICRQVLRFTPSRIVALEQAENPLFHMEREIKKFFSNTAWVGYICDICDTERVHDIFKREKPQVIFHAAAHKHVPLMERNPGEAIKNNVFGTRTIALAAIESGSEAFVTISTDKAVNPTSVMGASKRVAEMVIQDLETHSKTKFVTVRFGNVLGSNGSVVPIFTKQIHDGGPVTVTDERMTRYFMTIPEASQLVLQAAAMGKGGEIFVLDMGEPVKIVYLARELIRLSGLRPGTDIEIVFIGVRPGEKLFEELSTEGEDMVATSHEKIFTWHQRENDPEQISHILETFREVLAKDSIGEVVKALRKAVPEFVPPGESR